MDYFTFGMKKLRVTQNYNGSISHRLHWYNSKDYADYPIDIAGKDGKLSKNYRKSSEGAIDCVTAFCQECYTFWDGDNTICDNDGVWIRGNGDSANK